MNYYRGWLLLYSPSRPITGRWVAKRHGVSLCARTEKELKEMIDLREYDARERRA
jgi:hypothetical protein